MILGTKADLKQDFETREAGATALKGFYQTSKLQQPRPLPTIAELPVLMACYDVLNDDDENIREIGSEIIMNIFGEDCVACKAQETLMKQMALIFHNELSFAKEAKLRIMGIGGNKPGDLGPLLAGALVNDEALFMEEEQNLYVDEVSEFTKWTRLIMYKQGSIWDSLAEDLKGFVESNAPKLWDMLDKVDGPYGAISKPEVFTLCAKVVRITSCLIQRRKREIKEDRAGPTTQESKRSLEVAVDAFVIKGESLDFHPYLLDILRTL